jgi:hypothetical protein
MLYRISIQINFHVTSVVIRYYLLTGSFLTPTIRDLSRIGLSSSGLKVESVLINIIMWNRIQICVSSFADHWHLSVDFDSFFAVSWLWLKDPNLDSAIFVIDFQVAIRKIFFIQFFLLFSFEFIFTSYFKEKKKKVVKNSRNQCFYYI